MAVAGLLAAVTVAWAEPVAATPVGSTTTTTLGSSLAPRSTNPLTLVPSTSPPGGPPSPSVRVGGGFGPLLADEPVVGANLHATRWSLPALNEIYARLAAAGVTWVRIDLGWNDFEPGRGKLNESYVRTVDAAVTAAQAHGLEVDATLLNTPGWANRGQAENVAPTHPSDYAWLAGWAAGHFAGRINAWEIWNEEDNSTFWNPPDPARYAALLKVAYRAIKAADPAAIVVLGGLTYNDTSFLASLYSHGSRGSFDIVATHPYEGYSDNPPDTPDDGTPYTLAHITAVRDLMIQHGDAHLPIWFTEFGWSDHANTASSANYQLGVSATQQGDYLIETLRWVAANAPYVTHVFWYEATDETHTDVQSANYGLLTTRLIPKPSYTILRRYLTQSRRPSPTGA